MKKSKVLTFLAAGACTLSAFAAGVQTTLKATNPKGLVFAGWYGEDGSPLVGGADYRSPSLPYVMPDSADNLWARYALAQDDAASLGIDIEDSYNTSGEFDLALNVQSLSFPKVSVSGLPSGLKFDAKNLRISGTAKKPGTYTVTAKLTNTSVKKAIEKKFTIVVDNLTGANTLLKVSDAAGGAARLRNARGEKYEIAAGVSELDLPVLNVLNSGDGLTLSGLPPGLKYNARTGKIEGVATKGGTYTVTVTVKSGKATSVSTFTVEVRALPAWAIGTFQGTGKLYDSTIEEWNWEYSHWDGYSSPVDENLFGTLTVAANGKVTGSASIIWEDAEIYAAATFTAPALTGYDAETGCYYIDIDLAFWRDNGDGGEINGFKGYCRNLRFHLKPVAFDADGKLTIGEVSVKGSDAELQLTQDIYKIKGFSDRPVFAEKNVNISISRPYPGMYHELMNGRRDVTLTISRAGAVTIKYFEDYIEDGERVVNKGSYKANMVVTRHVKTAAEEYYLAEIPFHIWNKNIAVSFGLKLPVSSDGKVHERDCDFTSILGIDIGDFDEWPL